MRQIRQLTTELTFRCNAKCPACHRWKPLSINLNDPKYTISLERFKQLLDPGSITYIENPKVPIDPLRFKDEKKYVDRLKDSKKKTKISDEGYYDEGHPVGISSKQIGLYLSNYVYKIIK